MSAPVRSPPVPASLLTVAAGVERRLTEILEDERDRWTALDPDLAAPYDALAQLVLAGGKRLRPAFCHWGFAAAGGQLDGSQADAVVDIGAAFEFLHAFALLHDDVMDGSETRRGVRTAHLAFADLHDATGWRGEARRFGDGVAILIGDLAHVYADRLLEGVPPAVRSVWDELRIELNVGQYLDTLGTARGDADRVRARRIALYKSGKYTIERPLHVGAGLAGRLDDLAGPLSAYGAPLGEAFQLRDDLLGAFGEERVTGKPVGDDLREGKPTPLLAIAVERATPAQAAVLARAGAGDIEPADIAALQDVFVGTGAVDEIEVVIDRLTSEAIESIERAAVVPEARTALIELAHYVAWRTH
jgi:geranylgeranyl diphosphate synthase type I